MVAREFLTNGLDLPKAIKKINSNKELQGNCYNVQASLWRKDERFWDALRSELAKFDKTVLNDNWVLSNLFDITSNNNVKASDKINAIALVAKVLKLTDDNSNKQVNVSVFADQLNQLKPAIDVKNTQVNDKKLDNNAVDATINNITICNATTCNETT